MALEAEAEVARGLSCDGMRAIADRASKLITTCSTQRGRNLAADLVETTAALDPGAMDRPNPQKNGARPASQGGGAAIQRREVVGWWTIPFKVKAS